MHDFVRIRRVKRVLDSRLGVLGRSSFSGPRLLLGSRACESLACLAGQILQAP
jgi:hypothetical protein